MQNKQPIVVSFGGGLNSTAMIIGMWQKEIKPDLILFADTGGELPETYEHLQKFNDWLLSIHWPEIVTVKATFQGRVETLEENCARLTRLPSIAYGFKACSQKYKSEPCEKFINNWEPAKLYWKTGNKVQMVIGFDAGEYRRAKVTLDGVSETKKFENWYPLIQWEWFREECAKVCMEWIGYIPPKSSCFFCPNMKKHEILNLQKNHPELISRALKMEATAELTSVKGLGRSWLGRISLNMRRHKRSYFWRTQETCHADAMTEERTNTPQD